MNSSQLDTNHTDLIFENYSGYLSEHRSELSTASGAIDMLSLDSSFKAYINALTEGLDPTQKSAVFAVCDRQREMLLEESASIGPSSSVVGYAVTYFPILADIYADPVISKIATVHPTTKPINTIPKVQLMASVRNSDGTTKKYLMPRAQYLIRGASETVQLLPNTNVDLFAASAGYPNDVNSTLARINKRYFLINSASIKTKDTGDGKGETTTTVGLNLRPDARGQIHTEFEMTDDKGRTTTCSIVGHINWDTGVVQYSATFAPLTGAEFSVENLSSKVRFSPKTGEVGRVKVELKISGWDIDIDTKDEFEIELQSETISDYKDIYNIDLVRTMSEAIKQQIVLNKDFDMAYFLEAAEPELAANGTLQTLNFSKYMDNQGILSPRTLVDVCRSIAPRISMVNTVIHRNFRAEPQFLVTGLRTGALLKSMQQMSASIGTPVEGNIGFVGQAGSFMKQTVLMSPAVDDEKIYSIYKAPNDNLSRSVLIDFVYKPIYIIEEITNSVKRTFVKSRTAIELCSPHAVGCIKLTGMNDILGPDYRQASNIANEVI